jgi:hypothetical protein
MRGKLKQFSKKFPDEVGRALYIETEIESKEVKRRTPVDTGELRASVHVVGPIRRWRQIYTEIVAGGPAAPYAIYVHEDPDAFHPVGQWKFIESVVLESRPYMAARVAKRIDLNRAA